MDGESTADCCECTLPEWFCLDLESGDVREPCRHGGQADAGGGRRRCELPAGAVRCQVLPVPRVADAGHRKGWSICVPGRYHCGSGCTACPRWLCSPMRRANLLLFLRGGLQAALLLGMGMRRRLRDVLPAEHAKCCGDVGAARGTALTYIRHVDGGGGTHAAAPELRAAASAAGGDTARRRCAEPPAVETQLKDQLRRLHAFGPGLATLIM